MVGYPEKNKASLNIVNHHLKTVATKAILNRNILLCDPVVKQNENADVGGGGRG